MSNSFYTSTYSATRGALIQGQPFKTQFDGITTAFDLLQVILDEIVDPALMGSNNIFTASQTVTPVALTDGATVNTDASLSNHFTLTVGGNRLLANPTNLESGVILTWLVTQDGTGGWDLTYGSLFKWANGIPPALAATAGAHSYISGQYFSGPNIIVASMIKGLA